MTLMESTQLECLNCPTNKNEKKLIKILYQIK